MFTVSDYALTTVLDQFICFLLECLRQRLLSVCTIVRGFFICLVISSASFYNQLPLQIGFFMLSVLTDVFLFHITLYIEVFLNSSVILPLNLSFLLKISFFVAIQHFTST